jgi:peptidoglycan/LPS O-acetylase OafA/YrhL
LPKGGTNPVANRTVVLDGLRAVSILLVLGAHLLPLGPKQWQLNHTAGAMGMALFFALSGFLIGSLLLRDPDTIKFLARRCARILPLVVLYTSLLLIFQVQPLSTFVPTILFTLNYNTEFMDGYNAHFWSLCVEMQFYMAIAFVVSLSGSRGVWLVLPVALIITLVRVHEGAYIDIRTHLRVDEILTGAVVACFMSTRLKSIPQVPWYFVGASLFVLAACSHPQSEAFQYLRPYSAAIVLFFVLHLRKGFLSSILSSTPARYIAEVSYALYVVHPITAHGWMNEGSTAVRYLLKRPVSFALTFGFAHASTFFWEKPWTNWVKHKLNKRANFKHTPK